MTAGNARLIAVNIAPYNAAILLQAMLAQLLPAQTQTRDTDTSS